MNVSESLSEFNAIRNKSMKIFTDFEVAMKGVFQELNAAYDQVLAALASSEESNATINARIVAEAERAQEIARAALDLSSPVFTPTETFVAPVADELIPLINDVASDPIPEAAPVAEAVEPAASAEVAEEPAPVDAPPTEPVAEEVPAVEAQAEALPAEVAADPAPAPEAAADGPAA